MRTATTAIVEANSLTRASSGIWVREGEVASSDFRYSDGERAEAYLEEVIAAASDRSTFSPELERAIIDWPSEYHLSSKRSNLLRIIDIGSVQRALELGCGCGAVSRFLGEQGLALDAIEGSERRARIAALRCQDLDNVRIVHSNFNDVVVPECSYDAVLLIGVLEYARRFRPQAASDRAAVLDVLGAARRALKPDGIIVVAIENRVGLKYVLGASEDHYGVPYAGIFDYPESRGIRTYTRSEWDDILQEAGLPHYGFCYPFPDYKLPTEILREEFLNGNRNAYLQLRGVVSRDYGDGVGAAVDEAMLWQGLSEAGQIAELANAFLIVIGTKEASVSERVASDFVHVSGGGRRPCYRTVTSKPRGADVVGKQRLVPAAMPPAQAPVRQRCEQEPFREGLPLSEFWLRALHMREGLERLMDELRRYDAFVRARASGAETGRGLYDLLPGNITVGDHGELHAFDLEWESTEPVEPEFVLFRALLYFVNEHRRACTRLFRENGFVRTIDLVDACFSALGLNVFERLDGYVAREDSVQSAIRDTGAFVDTRQELQQNVVFDKFHAKLYWSVAGEDCSAANSVEATGSVGEQRQSLTFALPPSVSRLATLRLDPADRQGFFHLYRFSVDYVSQAGETRQLVDWRSGEEIAAHARPRDVHYGSSLENDVFVATTEQPLLEFPLHEHDQTDVAGNIRVYLHMDWPQSREFAVAREIFMRRELEFRRRAEGHEHSLRRVSELEKLVAELELIKRSKVWRTAERFRRLFYGGFLRRLPALRGWLLILTRQGWRTASAALRERLQSGEFPDTPQSGLEEPRDDYQRYRLAHALSEVDRDGARARIKALACKPKISIVMPVFNADRGWLEAAIESVKRQLYGNWELCIVDDCSTREETLDCLRRIHDPRVHLRFLDRNKNISGATNDAIAMACGDYIAFMDNDDELSEDALYEMVLAIDAHDPDVLYSDEDFISPDGRYVNPHFKPDFSPDLLLSHNYVTHLLVVRRALLSEVGALRSQFDGAQDYDFVLRATEKARVHHVAKVLYHWRMSERSTSMVAEVKPRALNSARGALEEALRRRRVEAEVLNANIPYFFRVKRALTSRPKVGIVIPFKDEPQLLERCVGAVLDKSTYENFEILGISNNSVSSETFRVMRRLARDDARFRAIELNVPFNFSRIVNHGVGEVGGEHVVLMNNDVEVISWDWMEALLEHSLRKEVGVVGGKLYYPNNTVQHAGIVVGIGGYAGHIHKGFAALRNGYVNRAHIVQNISAVTGAFMMVARHVHNEVGGFDEEQFAVACNDVDFCLRVAKRGYVNIFTPYAEAYHLESQSRGYEDTNEKRARFDAEKRRFAERHRDILERGDPYYNPNLSLDSENFAVRL